MSTPPPETETEQTMQLSLPDACHQPDRDPDPPPKDMITEAHAALHQYDEPTPTDYDGSSSHRPGRCGTEGARILTL